jgi:hypothetical protein
LERRRVALGVGNKAKSERKRQNKKREQKQINNTQRK